MGSTGDSEKKKLDPEKVLFHEYAHHFMFQHFAAAYPDWYFEGFAETAATIVLKPDGTFHIGNPPHYRSDRCSGMLNVSLERLLTPLRTSPTGEDVYSRFYGWLAARPII